MSFDRAKSALNGTRFADLRSVAETGSTNADMRQLLTAATDSAYPEGPVVLLAEHQSAGRGRLGRVWDAPPRSSVLMTVGYPLARVPVERWTLMTMCMSLAVTDATTGMDLKQVSIKWPNDIVVETSDADLGYRKLGGILAETARSPSLGDCLVIGLGLNVNWDSMPEELAQTAASMNSLLGTNSAGIDLDDLVTRILRSLDDRWLPLVEGSATDLEIMLSAYRERCSTLQRPVRVELPDRTIRGIATDIETDGALVVTGTDGDTRVTVGDVVHLRPDATDLPDA